jgi:hypothetical protein
MYGPRVQGSFFFFIYQSFLAATTAAGDLLGRLGAADVVYAEKQTCGLEIDMLEDRSA